MIKQQLDPNSVALPVKEYVVDTKCGRHFVWSAPDMDWLMRDIYSKKYVPVLVMELSEYEAEVAKREEQEKLNYEHKQAIEKGVA